MQPREAEQIALVCRAIEAYNRLDADALLAIAHPDIEWRTAIGGGVEGQAYHGHDGVRRYLRDMADAFEAIEIDDAEYRNVGGRIVMLGKIEATMRGTGLHFAQPFAIVAETADGLIRRGAAHLDHAAALAAAEMM